MIALALRDPDLLEPGRFPQEIPPTYLFVFVAFLCAVPSLLLFRVSDGLSHLFSIQDALALCAAVAVAVASSSLILFVFTRLEGIPRSTPLIYGLVLGAGLTFDRAVARVFHRRAWKERMSLVSATGPQSLRRIVVIGADRFAAITIKLLDHQRPRTIQAIAVLDARPAFIGRTVCGVKIIAPVHDLSKVLEEYVIHGVDINEIWLSDDAPEISKETIGEIAEYCGQCGIKFFRISEALNLAPSSNVQSHFWTDEGRSAMDVGDYFRVKRVFDVILALALLVALMPLALITAYLALIDVGAPVIFWQQRIGRNGRKFLLYKFRTYHAPFDKTGARIPEEQRLSKIGRMIRAARLDEIPQLLNVLAGDMSLIGPRPLLPHDQPTDPRIRLLVRPGITGWAQLNGGTNATAKEKDALDVWYIRHASIWLDLKIAVGTLLFAFTGEKMNHSVVEQALHWRGENQDAFGVAGETVVEESPRQAYRT